MSPDPRFASVVHLITIPESNLHVVHPRITKSIVKLRHSPHTKAPKVCVTSISDSTIKVQRLLFFLSRFVEGSILLCEIVEVILVVEVDFVEMRGRIRHDFVASIQKAELFDIFLVLHEGLWEGEVFLESFLVVDINPSKTLVRIIVRVELQTLVGGDNGTGIEESLVLAVHNDFHTSRGTKIFCVFELLMDSSESNIARRRRRRTHQLEMLSNRKIDVHRVNIRPIRADIHNVIPFRLDPMNVVANAMCRVWSFCGSEKNVLCQPRTSINNLLIITKDPNFIDQLTFLNRMISSRQHHLAI
mmetsp:Transcript_6016/g.9120  ORF Transcript_6016/g.9120 Transcript_6016/m.9120 type:complete len:302 (+) Transcript_6016:864-1769(+)